MRRLTLLTAFVIGLFAPPPAWGEGEQADRIQAVITYLEAHARNQDVSGMVVIRQKGRELLRQSYGQADYELLVPFSESSRFRIASITKTVTAAAVMLMVERGRIGLDDPVAKYVPDFPRGDKMTIRHVLLHRSGLPNSAEAADPAAPGSLAESVEAIKKLPLKHEPGSGGGYSGAGYTLLAYIVEQASGKPFADFLEAEVFRPLQMRRSSDASNRELVPGRVRGYMPGPPPAGWLNAPAMELTHIIGAGSLYSTVDDLLRWLEAMRTEKLFKISALEWPYGWGKRTYFDRLACEQTGMVPGFTSVVLTFPAEQLDIVALLNVETPFFNYGAREIAGILFGVPAAPVEERPLRIAMRPAELARFAGAYKAEPGFEFRIKLDGAELFAGFGKKPEWRYLYPAGATELYFPSSGARITARMEEGKVTALEWQARGDSFKLTRIR